MSLKFSGTGVAIITPFHEDNSIDFISLQKVTEHIIKGKADFIVALGTTGESVTLSINEKVSLVERLKEMINHRVKLVVGIGGYNTQEVLDNIPKFNFDGISAVLSVTPYYNKPQQRGMIAHFTQIANQSPVPLILYNVPSRTSVNLTADSVLCLAEHQNICAVKEASGCLEQITEIIRHKPEGFSVLSGDDVVTLPLLSLGADGVISVIANAFPFEFSQMVRYALNNDFTNARLLHHKLTDIMKTLFEDGSPSGIKSLLEVMQLSSNNLRLPLAKATDNIQNKFKQLISNF
ncbi:MAG: 4-hydroxy-tetrahydrodipicolinate synthase [Bacteroidota bacterium]